MDSGQDSLWDSRFDSGSTDDSGPHIATYASGTGADGIDIGDILAAASNDLPFVPSHRLTSESQLGRGGTFQVTREILRVDEDSAPRYVAVKRVITRRETTLEFQIRLASVLREVRVLKEPSVRSHPCIITTLGYGWSADPWQGSRPYLVMEYCDHGTLVQYLKRCGNDFQECRELAIDIALALECLHSHGIVHGDVKQDNVLVCDNGHPDEGEFRPQVAKLADFGSVIFESDIENQKDVYYLGTMRYNAPEIRGHPTGGRLDNKSAFELYKAADCYSFGLLAWEITRKGGSFIDKHILDVGETAEKYVDRLYRRGSDATLKAAIYFLNQVVNVQNRDEVVTTSLGPGVSLRLFDKKIEIATAFKNACRLCLKDDPLLRGNMEQIVQAISQGTSKIRSIAPYPPVKIIPWNWKPSEAQTIPLRNKTQATNFNTMLTTVGTSSPHLSIRLLEKGDYIDPALQIVKFVGRSPFDSSNMVAEVEGGGGLTNMFQAAMNVSPPWEVQCHVVKDMQAASTAGQNPARKAHAHLQLSVIYMIGYGVNPDPVQSLRHLWEASSTNTTARSLLRKVLPAFEVVGKQLGSTPLNHLVTSVYAFISADTADDSEDDWVDVGLRFASIRPTSYGNLRAHLDGGSHDKQAIYEGFLDACKQANATASTIFAYACTDFGPLDTPRPNPLHWLIKFDSADACSILQTVLSGPDGYNMSRRDGCLEMLASQSGLRLLLPDCGVEVFGTPLHWAVIAGHEDLVTEYIKLGADINIRLGGPVPAYGEQGQMRNPSYSPLDLAVAYHHHKIVKILLDSGGQTYGGDGQWMHSPFHTIGTDLIPFARYVAHGAGYRDAVRKTILILMAYGVDINGLDNVVHTPLVGAVQNVNAEPYITEELIAAGAKEHDACESSDGSLLVRAARSCMYRRFSPEKSRLVLPLVYDINAWDPQGQNALHYCALHDGVAIASVLLSAPGIEVDSRNSSGRTALQVAAAMGSLGVLEELIRADANLELVAAKKSAESLSAEITALEIAVSSRQVEAAVLLMRAGADTRFEVKDGIATRTVLHAAIYGSTLKRSCVKRLLDACPELSSHGPLDDFNIRGLTPLLQAVYYGDVEGVSALLEVGADHLKHKHPAEMSLGGTPLQLVNTTLRRATQRGNIPEVASVREAGKAAINEYLERLREIETILQRRSEVDKAM